MTPDLLDAEIAGTKALTAKPFGVNLITMHPMLFDLIAVCAKHDVSHVVLAGGLPPRGSLEATKVGGAKLICFAPALSLAKKLIRSGVDALVVESMERSEEHTSELQSLMRTSYAVFCLQKKQQTTEINRKSD